MSLFDGRIRRMLDGSTIQRKRFCESERTPGILSRGHWHAIARMRNPLDIPEALAGRNALVHLCASLAFVRSLQSPHLEAHRPSLSLSLCFSVSPPPLAPVVTRRLLLAWRHDQISKQWPASRLHPSSYSIHNTRAQLYPTISTRAVAGNDGRPLCRDVPLALRVRRSQMRCLRPPEVERRPGRSVLAVFSNPPSCRFVRCCSIAALSWSTWICAAEICCRVCESRWIDSSDKPSPLSPSFSGAPAVAPVA